MVYLVIDRVTGQINLETNDLNEAYARLQELDVVIEPGRFAIIDPNKTTIEELLISQV